MNGEPSLGRYVIAVGQARRHSWQQGLPKSKDWLAALSKAPIASLVAAAPSLPVRTNSTVHSLYWKLITSLVSLPVNSRSFPLTVSEIHFRKATEASAAFSPRRS